MEISSAYNENCSCYCSNCICPSCSSRTTDDKTYNEMASQGLEIVTFPELEEIKKGRIISAIRLVRARTGLNLRNAKNLVDKFKK